VSKGAALRRTVSRCVVSGGVGCCAVVLAAKTDRAEIIPAHLLIECIECAPPQSYRTDFLLFGLALPSLGSTAGQNAGQLLRQPMSGCGGAVEKGRECSLRVFAAICAGGTGAPVPAEMVAGANVSDGVTSANAETQSLQPTQVQWCDFESWPRGAWCVWWPAIDMFAKAGS
jgi:hypothetical protein